MVAITYYNVLLGGSSYTGVVETTLMQRGRVSVPVVVVTKPGSAVISETATHTGGGSLNKTDAESKPSGLYDGLLSSDKRPTMIRPIAICEPQLSMWCHIKKSMFDWLVDSPRAQILLGLDSTMLSMWREDKLRRAEVRAEMLIHSGFETEQSSVGQAIVDINRNTGYDMSDLSSIRRRSGGTKRTKREWDYYFLHVYGVDLKRCPQPVFDALFQPEQHRVKTCVVPKFSASMALHLRAKLGRMTNNEANCLLVEKEYLRVCRKFHVRDVDIVAHQQITLNAVFDEYTLDSIALTRTRLPAWLKWLDTEKYSNTKAC